MPPRQLAVALLAASGLVSTTLTAGSRTPTDLAIEHCLTEAQIVERLEVLVGVTKPVLYAIECEGQRSRAIFKSLDESRQGRTLFDSGRSEINFTDSFRYERAAYLLDRELDLHRVPVAVIRNVEGRSGVLLQWIEDASTEIELRGKLTTQELVGLAKQKSSMHVFDALIYNTDRRPENWLVGHQDSRLFLIDHSRAFRLQRQLPEDFASRPARLSRELLAELQDLNERDLTELLEGLIDKPQIRALLARRDLILEKIVNDVAKLGEAAVLTD